MVRFLGFIHIPLSMFPNWEWTGFFEQFWSNLVFAVIGALLIVLGKWQNKRHSQRIKK
jgi:hypothetical protein